jgi:hypothetical protein
VTFTGSAKRGETVGVHIDSATSMTLRGVERAVVPA